MQVQFLPAPRKLTMADQLIVSDNCCKFQAARRTNARQRAGLQTPHELVRRTYNCTRNAISGLHQIKKGGA